MSVFFAFMASDMRAVSCDVSWFLALKTSTSSFDIMLTIEDGRMVAVSCCAALSFSTSVMASFSVCRSFSLIRAAKLCTFFSPFMKILMVAGSFVKLQHLASILN